MQDYATLRIEQTQPHTLLVTLNRPDFANAMNTQMGRDLLPVSMLQRRARRRSAASCSPVRGRARSAPGAT